MEKIKKIIVIVTNQLKKNFEKIALSTTAKMCVHCSPTVRGTGTGNN